MPCCYCPTNCICQQLCCRRNFGCCTTQWDHDRAQGRLDGLLREYEDIVNHVDINDPALKRRGVVLVKNLDAYNREFRSHPLLTGEATQLKVRVGREIFGIADYDGTGVRLPAKTQDERDLEAAARSVALLERDLEKAREKRAEIENRRKDYFVDGTYLIVEDRLGITAFRKQDGEWRMGRTRASWELVRQHLDGKSGAGEVKVYNVDTMQEI